MGHSRWDGAVYNTYSSTRSSMRREEIFSGSNIDPREVPPSGGVG